MVLKQKVLRYVVLALMAVAILFAGCKGKVNEPEAAAAAYEVLTDYLVANDMDLSDVLNAGFIVAADVAGNEANYYIMDIRSADDFAAGRIAGAVQSTLGTIVTDAGNSGGNPIIVVCKSGQTAGHAVIALRLSGYSTAQVLKFGMSSWSAAFDGWTSNTGNIAVGHANWSTDATATPAVFDAPGLSVTASEGAAILAERVTAMLTGGFKAVAGSDVLTTPANYFINNYFAEADVATYGHISGAYRINPLTLENGEISNLDPTKTVVTYCWTGQTSSMITAYLTVLGFDATSLKFGVNGLIYDNLTAHKWTGSGDYTVESN
ncbi:rhodanese-like domain-containing protein [candidate division KSB1 bacterium]|nr:rhodanese-like domain-containing protein [candidate division KSB1 bacterium]